MLVENLGPIKKCDISLGQETIFLGKNNSGKTYISYLLYGIYKEAFKWKDDFITNWLKNNIKPSLDEDSISINKAEFTQQLISEVVLKVNTHIHERLPTIFNMNPKEFENTKIELKEADLQFFIDNSLKQELLKEYSLSDTDNSTTITFKVEDQERKWIFKLINEIHQVEISNNSNPNLIHENITILLSLIFQQVIFKTPNTLYIPAERNGINVFRKDLLEKRGAETFVLNFEKKEKKTVYPMPISDYMRYLANVDKKSMDEKVNEKRLKVWEAFTLSVLKGKYIYNENQDEYFYREVSGNEENIEYKTKDIPLQVASSSAKSLFGLEYYIKRQFSKGDILFIDEPEMNLDPSNQVNIASLLTLLAKEGVKVIISTHSDYLIRAVTNDILEAKINSTYIKDEIQAYYFDVNEINALGDLSSMSYLADFDDINAELEDKYFSLQDKLDSEDSQ